MAQACELSHASARSSSHASIASDTSRATFANSAQSSTTSTNNCAITKPCATGNFGNTRRRHKYSTSSHASQGDWRAAYPGITVYLPSYLCYFDPITGAPRSTSPTLKRRTQLTFRTGINGRRLLLNKRRPSATSCSIGRASTCRVHSSSNRERSARRTRRFKKSVRRPSTGEYVC